MQTWQVYSHAYRLTPKRICLPAFPQRPPGIGLLWSSRRDSAHVPHGLVFDFDSTVSWCQCTAMPLILTLLYADFPSLLALESIRLRAIQTRSKGAHGPSAAENVNVCVRAWTITLLTAFSCPCLLYTCGRCSSISSALQTRQHYRKAYCSTTTSLSKSCRP